LYLGNLEIEKDILAQTSKQINYISAPTGLCAVFIKNINHANQTESSTLMLSPQTDHLGSIVLLCNSEGDILERNSYDAWGRARNATFWNNYETSSTTHLLDCGYTFHEMLPEFGLINMNARLYDPILCRMLSPDEHLLDPQNSQNYNKYSYALNNPIRFTDPTGNNPYWVWEKGNLVQKEETKAQRERKEGFQQWQQNNSSDGSPSTEKDFFAAADNTQNKFELYYAQKMESIFKAEKARQVHFEFKGTLVLVENTKTHEVKWMNAKEYDALDSNSGYELCLDLSKGSEIEVKEEGANEGGVSFGQAQSWYQFAGGAPMNLNINTIDFSRVSMSEMNGKLIEVNLDNPFKHMTNINDALVYGTLYLYQENGNVFRAAHVNEINGRGDNYNFDVKWFSPKEWLSGRNENTILGGLINGLMPIGGSFIYVGGTPYPIYLHGTITIKP